jgi:ATP-dependent DNA ligase
MIFHPDMIPRAKKWDGRDIVVNRCEFKLDGWRLTLVKDFDGVAKAYFRGGVNRIADLPQHVRSRVEMLPHGTIVDGELHQVGEPASNIPHLIKARSVDLEFQPFCVPMAEGIDLRRIDFMLRDTVMSDLGWSPPQQLEAWSLDERELKRDALRLGIEGFVLKESHCSGWWKVKPQPTVDAFVVGVVPGKGKHITRNGALVVAVYDGSEKRIIANVGKGNDEMWRDLSREDVLFRTCEVAHEGVQSKGRLKFSSFLRWRDDKLPQECLLMQLQ